ncbi:MAG: immunoglobulin domain-containing protein [Verrucomicrobiota bacterium]
MLGEAGEELANEVSKTMKLPQWMPHRACLKLMLILLPFLAVKAEAAFLNATGVVTSLSFELGEGTSNAGRKLYYNTYDGVPGFSRSQVYYSVEVMPVNLGAANFATDYDIYRTGYPYYDGHSPIGYGTASFTIPTTDTDGDGLTDFFDRSRAFQATINGNSSEYVIQQGSRSYNVACTFNRASNTEVGTYTFTTSAAQITGFFFLEYGKTKITYDPETRAIVFSGTSFGYGNEFSGEIGSGTSTYEILSPTSIRVNAFTFTTPYKSVNVNPFVMNRSGNKFICTGSMQDGRPYTPWADFKDFFFAFNDTNDADGDGIPDLSDALIYTGPTIITEPTNASVLLGASTNLKVIASSPFPMTYQWYLNNSLLEGKTEATLPLINVQPAQAGNYTAVVISNGKTKTSQAAVLTVLIAPQVTLSPASVRRITGKVLDLHAAATGVPSPTYEWYRGDILLTGRTGATLTLSQLALTDSGNYTVKAINSVGSAVSNPAKVVITKGIFSTPDSSITHESLKNNGFPLHVEVEIRRSYRIEYTTDMINWTTLVSYPMVGHTIEYVDTTATTNSLRFYRVVAQ